MRWNYDMSVVLRMKRLSVLELATVSAIVPLLRIYCESEISLPRLVSR